MPRSARFFAGIALVFAAFALLSAPASAFTTRVHIALANDIREELIRSNDGTVRLQLGDVSVTLAEEDARAIADNPLAFRAGAIGPDNFIFPAMTDPTHAVGLFPYDQCELLYQAAVTDEERAYALGCFLHGTTDAIAHHIVNYLTGETFTLNPISHDRGDSFDNVIRHIVAESMIQHAWLESDPDAFSQGQLFHNLPRGFTERMYLDTESPIWALMSTHALEKHEAAAAANPGADLFTVIQASGLAPAEYLVMMPVYLEELDAMVVDLRLTIESEITRLQDHSDIDGFDLWVQPGPDGLLGTWDDETDCAVSCPVIYATYFTYVGLLLPREDAGGNPLPPAFDKIAEKLRADLFQLKSAYLDTIENVSTLLNAPLSAGADGGDLGIDRADVTAALQPLQDWVDDITTIDYETAVRAVVPNWLFDLEALLNAVGVDVSVAGIVQWLFQPIIDDIRAAIDEYVLGTATEYLGELIDEFELQRSTVEDEFHARLEAAVPEGLAGTYLDYWLDSGVYGYAFNIAAATFAERDLVLPDGEDWAGIGPASFDASHTLSWMQPGVCGYLREAIFPLGLGVAALTSVKQDAEVFASTVPDDAPIECHDGSLSTFTDEPDAAVCSLTDLDSLLADPIGSLSRAFPPGTVSQEVLCRNLVVPGLPEPPEDPGNPDDPDDLLPGGGTGCSAGGCASQAGGGSIENGWVVLVIWLGIAGMMRRRAGARGAGQADSREGRRGGGPFAAGDRPVAIHREIAAVDRTASGSLEDEQRDVPMEPSATAQLLLAIHRAIAAAGFAWRGRGDGAEAARRLRRRRQGKVMTNAEPRLRRRRPSSRHGHRGAGERDEGRFRMAGSWLSRAAVVLGLCAMISTGCKNNTDTGDESPGDDDSATTEATPTPSPTPTPTPSPRARTLEFLGDSVWNGTGMRDGRQRVIQYEFRADSLLWAEIRNPWGPGRHREMRSFALDDDGVSVHTTVITPGGWPLTPDNGREDDWTFELIDGDPRRLHITRSAVTEEYTEGAVPAPQNGLTATAYAFAPGGTVDDAFCSSGAGGFDYQVMFDFARGRLTNELLATDTVAGARLLTWSDSSGNNQFAITDVDGFSRDGGTLMSEQFNFFVRYTGTVTHPGGELGLREEDDSVEDAVYAFVDSGVGSNNTNDLFLGVHGFWWPDETSDEEVANFAAGAVPIEIIVIRCAAQISDVDVQMRIAGGPWLLVGNQPTLPEIDPNLFPPVF